MQVVQAQEQVALQQDDDSSRESVGSGIETLVVTARKRSEDLQKHQFQCQHTVKELLNYAKLRMFRKLIHLLRIWFFQPLLIYLVQNHLLACLLEV